MFHLSFLPATIGDAIWISYGNAAKPHHVLIDGGTAGTRKHIVEKIRALDEDKRLLDLVVVSHVDKDHINGIRTLLERQSIEIAINDFWYNGFHHLPVPPDEDEALGAKQGEALTAALVEHGVTWNRAFDSGPVFIPDSGPLPVRELPGGMKLTLLGPTMDGLAKLRPVWVREVVEGGLVPGAVEPPQPDAGDDERLGVADFLTADDVAELAQVPCPGDSSSANGSSIALLAEFEGKRVLLAADAHVDHLLAALERLSPGTPLPVDLFKVSHHGSRGTTDRTLIEKVATQQYVFSTNGSIFKHPHDDTVAKVLTFGGNNPVLHFNYRRPTNTVWEEVTLQSDIGYTTRYPANGTEGIDVDL